MSYTALSLVLFAVDKGLRGQNVLQSLLLILLRICLQWVRPTPTHHTHTPTYTDVPTPAQTYLPTHLHKQTHACTHRHTHTPAQTAPEAVPLQLWSNLQGNQNQLQNPILEWGGWLFQLTREYHTVHLVCINNIFRLRNWTIMYYVMWCLSLHYSLGYNDHCLLQQVSGLIRQVPLHNSSPSVCPLKGQWGQWGGMRSVTPFHWPLPLTSLKW